MNQKEHYENGKGSSLAAHSKIKVAVLLGGDSREREISLESGRNVCYKISPHKYEVTPVFVTENMDLYAISQKELVKNTTRAIVPLLREECKILWSSLPKRFDFVFIALHGGKGENGSLQGALEMLDVPYNGSGVFASALCMDKHKTAKFLKHKGFDVPSSILISQDEWNSTPKGVIQKVSQTFSLPWIVKPHDDGCSMLVYKIRSIEDLETTLNEFFASEKKYALIEEFIKGTELTVGVIGNENPRAFPASQPVVQDDILSIEEKFLPGAGENQTPALITPTAMALVQKTMEDVYRAIGCQGYVRIDCFYQDAHVSPSGHERVVILEINTLPGLTPATCIFHQAAEVGMKPMDFIDMIISLGIERFRLRKLNLFEANNHKELHQVQSID
jgi:D-alanine-D-alanine ligase